MHIVRGIRQDELSLNVEDLEKVKCFRYPGADLAADGTMGVEVSQWVEEGGPLAYQRVLGGKNSL